MLNKTDCQERFLHPRKTQ